MIVAYAAGAGLGHLTRVRAARHTLGLDDPLVLVTDSPWAGDRRVVGEAEVVAIEPPRADPAAARAALAGALRRPGVTRCLLDAFPAGLAGEVDADALPDGVPVLHLARRLRWDRYAPTLPAHAPRLDRVVLVEPVGADQADHLDRHAARPVEGPVALDDPDEPSRDAAGAPFDPAEVAGAWLVVHAGPPAEVAELVAYACDQARVEGADPEVVVVTPGGGSTLADLDRDGTVERAAGRLRVRAVDVYPARPLFDGAARIVTAGGWNSVRQLAPWRDKHRPLPVLRRLDDQFVRVATGGRPPGHRSPLR
ncbi:MAG: hypothetical protein U0Q07_03300 [Acidimicrobiales bacterium]